MTNCGDLSGNELEGADVDCLLSTALSAWPHHVRTQDTKISR
jgi:hypothetical protein